MLCMVYRDTGSCKHAGAASFKTNPAIFTYGLQRYWFLETYRSCKFQNQSGNIAHIPEVCCVWFTEILVHGNIQELQFQNPSSIIAHIPDVCWVWFTVILVHGNIQVATTAINCINFRQNICVLPRRK